MMATRVQWWKGWLAASALGAAAIAASAEQDTASRDNFANARPISGVSGQSSFDNAGYTKESGEPVHSSEGYPGGASAWAVWTAPASGDWTFCLSGRLRDWEGDMDPQLAVYTGASVAKLTRVAANDDANADGDDFSSRVSFRAEKGKTYRIAMDSYLGDQKPGTLLLRWERGVYRLAVAHSPQWVSMSGGRQTMEVDASAVWTNAADCAWIKTASPSGNPGDSLVYTVGKNDMESERTGQVTLRAGQTAQAVLTVRQHPMRFVTTKKAAVEAALRENKRILMVWGREGCGNTIATLWSSIPSTDVKPLVEDGYVLWYSNCDRQSDGWNYAIEGTLPTVAIVDPADGAKAVASTNGYQDADSLLAFFQANPSWGYRVENGKAIVTKAVPASGKLAVPATLGGHPVGAIDAHAFQAATELTGLTIPAGVADIGEGAFAGCTGLRTLRIPDSVSKLGKDAFSGCVNLKTLYVPAAWHGTSALAEAGIPEGCDVVYAASVKFNANGGSVSPASRSVLYGQVIGALPVPTRSGQTFVGWYTAKTGGSKVAATTTVTASRTLYAHWAKTKYKVAFDANGGSGTMAKQTMAYGKAAKLRKNAFTREGCMFLGWAKTKKGAVAYKNGAKVKNLRTDGKTMTLYAKWAKKSYTVAFKANGGKGKMAKQKMTYGKAAKLRKNAFKRKGYTFLGWAKTKKGEVAYKNAAKVKNLRTDGKTTTLYAKWAKNTYQVAFNANGGKGKMAKQQMTYGKKAKLRKNTFKRNGYTFLGWSKTKKGAVVYKNGAKVLNLRTDGKTMTLYAQWKVAKKGAKKGLPQGAEVTTSDGMDGSAVADGDESTGWTPEETKAGVWVVLSFAKALDVAEVEVVGENLPEEGMRVLLSEDAESWREGVPGPARYVWVAFPEGAERVDLREVRVVEAE